MPLRDYQERAITRVGESYRAGNRKVLLALPTGSGKTPTACNLIGKVLSHGKIPRVWFLAHRKELIKQASDKLREWGIKPGVQFDPTWMHLPVQVASVQTWLRRRQQLKIQPNEMIVADECHRGEFFKALTDFMGWVLGLTATPWRLDGTGLGECGYTDLIEGATTAELIDDGWLVPYTIYENAMLHGRVKRSGRDYDMQDAARQIVGNPVEQWRKHADGLKTLVSCCNVEHAEGIAALYRLEGLRAAAVSGDDPLRDAKMQAFRDNDIQILAFCDLITEGLDVPDIACVQMLRPTLSLNIYRQVIGRGMRPLTGVLDGVDDADERLDRIENSAKPRLVILDHVGNRVRHKTPCAPINWSLTGKVKVKKEEQMERWDVCKGCAQLRRLGAPCPYCGYSQASKRSDPEIVDGELAELTGQRTTTNGREELNRLLRAVHEVDTSHEKLRVLEDIAGKRGYKEGWVRRMVRVYGLRF